MKRVNLISIRGKPVKKFKHFIIDIQGKKMLENFPFKSLILLKALDDGSHSYGM